MPLDLAALVDPAHTALVTSECQNGVIGEPSALPELAIAAAASVVPRGAALCAAAREAGVPVVHCLYARRVDNRGTNTNARLFAAMERVPVRLEIGSPAAELVDEFGPDPRDLVLRRLHGINPMAGTDLDPVLRNLAVSTLVVIGVSVNVAITNLVMDAVNLGYRVVLPRDAVAGVPANYAAAVIDNTLSLLATVTTTDALTAAWSRGA